MEMSVPYRVCTEVPPESDIWGAQGRYRANTAEAMRREEGGDNRSRGVRRSYPHARKSSAASKCSTVYGISQGEEHANDI